VLSRLSDWLDSRTGYKKFVSTMLLEHVPGGARWRYVWGSMLAFTFSVQLITGILLMTAYSPGNTTAWGSVYFIQYEMEFGWLIRGLHHFGSQAMVVLLGCHMLQVVIAGAQLPPREVNWWLGLALMGAILGLSLTGYLLPWDQKGYWATGVATNIAGSLPGVGSAVQRVLVGGPAYGNATLSRFYALHVGVLPLAAIVLLVLHIVAFRRHGVTAPKGSHSAGVFWPDQAFRDMAACMILFALLLCVVIWGRQGNPLETGTSAAEEKSLFDQAAYGGRDGRGANLDAPADPSQPYPARPEWYFLFLFQLLKYFEGEDYRLIGTVVIPNAVGVLLFLLPLLGYGRMRPLGHMIGVVVVVAVLGGAALLTCLAAADDMADPVNRYFITQLAFIGVPLIAGLILMLVGLMAILPYGFFRNAVWWLGMVVLLVLAVGVGSGVYGALSDTVPAQVRDRVQQEVVLDDATKRKSADIGAFREKLEHADISARRAIALAHNGIPAEGAVLLLQRDPKTAGKALFEKNCASCHRFGRDFPISKSPLGSDLAGFGSPDPEQRKKWIRDFLENPSDKMYFGGTDLEGMKKWCANMRAGRDKLNGKDREEFEAWLDRLATWLASHPAVKEEPAENDLSDYAKGYRAFFGPSKKINNDPKQKFYCERCHGFGEGHTGSAPDLAGYGSQDWIRLMIMSPGSYLRHGQNNKMPAFRPDKHEPGDDVAMIDFKNAGGNSQANTPISLLSHIDRELIIRYITHDDRLVFFGRPVSGPEDKSKGK
jgi:quinol-cytochrome oxidoreductase complex cytochrome b subunit/mono/diheme cytochrome c family protein